MRSRLQVGALALAVVGGPLVCLVLAGEGEPPAAGPQAAPAPPWQRTLTEADARRANELVQKIGQLRDAGKYAEALEAARALLALSRGAQGGDHWETVNATWHVRTLKSIIALPPERQRELARARKQLAEAERLDDQDKYAAAGALFEQVLVVYRRILGEEHPDTAAVYDSAAVNRNRQGRFAESEALHRRSLDIGLRLLGEDHRDTAVTCNKLAFNLDDQGRYADAEPWYRRSLAIRRRVFGEEHPATAVPCDNLALNLGKQGRYADAEPLVRKALTIRRRALGDEHPDTVRNVLNLAGALFNLGRLGEGHPETLLSYNNLAFNLNAQGRYAEAEPLFDKALAIGRQALGEDHARMGIYYGNVAHNLAAQGRYAEAEPPARRSLAILHTAFGKNHPRTAKGYHNLAHILAAQGRYAEAEAMWTEAAHSFEVTRLRASLVGLERSPFAAEQSPLPFLTAVLARNGTLVVAGPGITRGMRSPRRVLRAEVPKRTAKDLKRWGNQASDRLSSRITGAVSQARRLSQRPADSRHPAR